MKAVKARKDRIVAQSIESLMKWLDGTPYLDMIRGHARFTGTNSVEVESRTLRAGQIFLNVGGRAVLPNWHGIADVPVLTPTG